MFHYRLLLLWSIFLIMRGVFAQPNTESFSNIATTQYLNLSYATIATTDGKQEDRFSPQQTKSPEFCLCESSFMSICDCQNTMAGFGVYDGHGRLGAFAAEHARDYLFKNLKSNLMNNQPVSDALKNAFLDTNHLFSQRATIQSGGTTAAIALFKDKKLHIANVGDTEAITYFGNTNFFDTGALETVTRKHHAGSYGEYQRLTDFGPENEMLDDSYSKKAWLEEINALTIRIKQFDETMRPIIEYDKKSRNPVVKTTVLKCLCTTTPDNGRCTLVPSRTIGDMLFQPFVTAMPFVQTIEISESGFMLIASDGLWDLISKKAAAQFICYQCSILGSDNAQLIVQNLMALVLGHAANCRIELDDITATLIFIQPHDY